MFKNRPNFKDLSHLFVQFAIGSLLLLGVQLTAVAQDDAAEADAGGASAEVVAEGASIFNNNCSVCHDINSQVVGPALKGVNDRRDEAWLISFIKNSQKVIQSGDKYAVDLFNKFNKTVMPPFALSDDQIRSVLAYIESESNAAAAAPADGGADDGGGQQKSGTEGGGAGGVGSEYLSIILIGLLVVLVLILVVLVLIISVMTRFLNQRADLDEDDKEELSSKTDIKKTVTSGPFIGIVVFIFLSIAVKVGLDGLYSIGIQQGYMPKQPIAFSHQLHAGQYEIPCQYCHTGVMKGKSANIPSANICMNCHQQIKPESPEIQKIYAAIDFNPETQTYGNNKKPIEWVRIHNLPDFAYFNHAQHVNVGGVECQTCHGPIQEMPVVYQYSKLTMGWCINCHRETQVNAEGNAYYDKLMELHQQANAKEPLTVDGIGGLECSKCHY